MSLEKNYMQYMRIIPLFLFILGLYNLLAMFGVQMEGHLFQIQLFSGELWGPSSGDILMMLGIFTLYIELMKSTSSDATTIIEHTLSIFVFIAFLIEFIVMKSAATSAFVMLMLMSLLDIVAGFSITVTSARRDMNFNH